MESHLKLWSSIGLSVPLGILHATTTKAVIIAYIQAYLAPPVCESARVYRMKKL